MKQRNQKIVRKTEGLYIQKKNRAGEKRERERDGLMQRMSRGRESMTTGCT